MNKGPVRLLVEIDRVNQHEDSEAVKTAVTQLLKKLGTYYRVRLIEED